MSRVEERLFEGFCDRCCCRGCFCCCGLLLQLEPLQLLAEIGVYVGVSAHKKSEDARTHEHAKTRKDKDTQAQTHFQMQHTPQTRLHNEEKRDGGGGKGRGSVRGEFHCDLMELLHTPSARIRKEKRL